MLAVLLALCVPIPPSPANLVHFGARDMARYSGHLAYFVGTVGELGGVEEIYTADLETNGLSGYHVHAIIGRQQWKTLKPGDRVAWRGMLRTHSVDGERYAVLWVIY